MGCGASAAKSAPNQQTPAPVAASAPGTHANAPQQQQASQLVPVQKAIPVNAAAQPFTASSKNPEIEQMLHGLGVKDPNKVCLILLEQGIETRKDFGTLDEELRKELDEELKKGGVSIGDRAKVKKAKAEVREVVKPIGNGEVSVPQLVPGQAMQVASKLERVFLGMGWTGKGANQSVDVDASCVAFSGGKVEDLIYFSKLRNDSKSCVHTGDVLTGAAPDKKKDLEDMERIYVWLSKLPKSTDCLVFVANIYSAGISFAEIDSAYVRMVNADTNQELCRVPLSGGGLKGNCLVFCKLYRTPPAPGQKGDAPWQMLSLGMPTEVKGMSSVEQMMPMLMQSGTAHPPRPVNPIAQPGQPGCAPPPAKKAQKPRSVLPCVALAVAGAAGIAAATAIFMNSDLSSDMMSSDVFTSCADFSGDALEFTGDALCGAGDLIGEGAGEVYGWAGSVVDGIGGLDGIADGLGSAADWTANSLSYAAGEVGDFAGDVMSSDAFAAAQDGLADAGDAMAGMAENAGGAIADGAPGALDAMEGAGAGAMDAMGEGAGAVGGFAQDAGGTIADGAPGAFEAVGDVGGAAASGAGGFFSGIGASLGGLASGLGDALGGMGGAMGDVMGGLGDALEGIADAAGDLGDG